MSEELFRAYSQKEYQDEVARAIIEGARIAAQEEPENQYLQDFVNTVNSPEDVLNYKFAVVGHDHSNHFNYINETFYRDADEVPEEWLGEWTFHNKMFDRNWRKRFKEKTKKRIGFLLVRKGNRTLPPVQAPRTNTKGVEMELMAAMFPYQFRGQRCAAGILEKVN